MATGLSNGSGLAATSSSLILRALNSGLSWTGSSSGPAGAFFSAVVAAGGTVSAGRQTLYTNLFNSLTSAGLLTKLDRLGIFAAENQITANIDLIDPTKSVTPATGTATPIAWGADIGYSSPNGSQSYLDTGAVSNALAHFSQNSATWALGSLSTRGSNSDIVSLGTAQSAGGNVLFMRSSGPTLVHGVNDTNIFGSTCSPPAATVKGLYMSSRTASDANAAYFNGGISIHNGTEPSAPPLALSFLLCCWRWSDNVTRQQFTDDNVCVYALGGGLSYAETVSFATIINTYMTAIGSPLF